MGKMDDPPAGGKCRDDVVYVVPSLDPGYLLLVMVESVDPADSTGSRPDGPASSGDGPAVDRAPAEEAPGVPEEVEKFLVAFARAVQKYVMYPSGHPALEPAARSVKGALDRATEERTRLELSVAPDRIGIEDASTDPGADLFRSLAQRLHRHHLSVVSVEAGAGEEEIANLLEALSVEATEEDAAGLRFDGMLPGCPNVQLKPVPYAAMRLADDSEEMREQARSLWFELARVAQRMGEDADSEEVPLDPKAVARALEESADAGPAFAEDVMERLSEASRLFRGTRKREGEGAIGTLSDQMSTLVRELPPEALVRLLESGGTPEQARQILFDVSYQLDSDSMEKVLESVADTRFVEISGWLERILGKLGSHARSSDLTVSDEADEHMRAQIRDMVARWELENPNPTEYEEALSRLAVEGSETGTSHLATAEALRMVRMGLEVDTGGDWISRAAGEVRHQEERPLLVRDLMATPDDVEAAEDAWQGIVRPDWIRDFLSPPVPDAELVEPVLARCTPRHADVLLDVLADSESRSVRRAIFDRLVEMGDPVGSEVVRRLSDERWYIRRNLLALLSEMDELPPGFSAASFLQEDHPEVRHEAISLALRDPEARGDAIDVALDDPHSRTVILGLTAARRDCPPELVPRVAEAARDEELSWTVRVHAIRALGGIDQPEARDALVDLVTRRHWPFFWKRRIRAPSDPVLEGLRVLRDGWSHDDRAAELLEIARESDHERIRAAAGGDAGGGAER